MMMDEAISFIIFLEKMIHTSGNTFFENRAFLHGDAVNACFYIRNSKLILTEECYFYLMASMRKMRMAIPMGFTLDFFQNLFQEIFLDKGISEGVITFMVYRREDGLPAEKSAVDYIFSIEKNADILAPKAPVEMDLIKEISVGAGLLDNLRVHRPENIYAEIYARENGMQDLLLLNPSKRLARSIHGNILLLEGGTIRVPKQAEGAYISPLMESFITYLHYQKLAETVEAEILPFESQKAEEILIISDNRGIFPVNKIRNKTFSSSRFTEMLAGWRASFL